MRYSMTLTHLVKHVSTKLTDAGRKYLPSKALIGTAVGLSALAYGGKARANVYDIDPSWVVSGSPAQVNALLDEDPGTLAGPYGNVVLQPGDEVHAAAGTYQRGLGQGRGEFAVSGVPGNRIKLICAGEDENGSNFIVATPTSGMVWQSRGDDMEINNCSTQNANTGINVETSNYQDIWINN